MSEVFDKIKKGAKNLKSQYEVGSKETTGLGTELRERAQMNKVAEEALNPPKPQPSPAAPAMASPKDRINKGAYGSGAGEKRIDTSTMTKPLGSFKKGTNRVPETGIYKLEKDEAVIPAEKNPMNAADAMAGISKGDKKPPKKIAEIRSKKSHDGKIIHTHMHHHPMHHGDETYVSNDAAAMAKHMTDQEPNMSAAAPEMTEAAASPAAGAMPSPAGM